MNKKILLLSLLVVVLIGAGCSTAKQEMTNNEETKNNDPIKIGFIAPLTGDAATVGESMKYAVEIARDEINQAGGVDGRQVEVIFEDGKCDAKEAVSAGTKLINMDKVQAIIGGACSSETLAVAPMAEEAKVVMVSAASTNPEVSNAGDYIFRFIPADTFQGEFAANYLVNELGYKKIALVYVNNDWGLGIKNVFKKKINSLDNAKIVLEESYTQDATDLRTVLAKIKNSGADVIYFVGSSEASIPALKQKQELEITTPIFGADMWDDPKIPAEAGSAAEGAMLTIAANLELPEGFVEKMNEKTGGTQIGTYPPRAYDVMKALGKIMLEKGTTAEDIKSGLYSLKDYQGIADKYTIDENGDMAGSNYVVKKYQDGKIIEL